MTQKADNQNEEIDIDEVTETLIGEEGKEIPQVDVLASSDEKDASLQERFTRLQADYDNFKKRSERDRGEMVFFINAKTFSIILPRLDDLERIIINTPQELKGTTFFSGVEALYKTLSRDIETLGIKAFISKGESVNPDKHDVMTQVPGEEGIIIDEFEKGYMLGERVIRHAKVVVGNGN